MCKCFTFYSKMIPMTTCNGKKIKISIKIMIYIIFKLIIMFLFLNMTETNFQ